MSEVLIPVILQLTEARVAYVYRALRSQQQIILWAIKCFIARYVWSSWTP
jgi:hypothetical protein